MMEYISKVVARVEGLRYPIHRRLGTYRGDRGTVCVSEFELS